MSGLDIKNSVLVVIFDISFSIGFCFRLTDHRISVQQKALTVGSNPIGTAFKSKVARIDTWTQTFRTTATQGHHFGYHRLLAFHSILILDVRKYICNSD
jgi:hypothetical protein